jgi:hypothetical protein
LPQTLTKPQIRKLAEVEVIQLGLFEQVNLVEFESEDYRKFGLKPRRFKTAFLYI